MFVLGNFVKAAAAVLDTLLYLYMIIVVIRVVISWVNPDPRNLIVQILHSVTDPVLDPIRRRLFRMMGYRGMMIDFSPIILILAILFLDLFLVDTLYELGRRLQ